MKFGTSRLTSGSYGLGPAFQPSFGFAYASNIRATPGTGPGSAAVMQETDTLTALLEWVTAAERVFNRESMMLVLSHEFPAGRTMLSRRD